MSDETIALLRARLKECIRMAEIGIDGDSRLPQFYNYAEQVNFIKAVLLLEKVSFEVE